MRLLLITTLAISGLTTVTVATPQNSTWILECKGEYSKFTTHDCAVTANLIACYFIPDFDVYESCATICNNVVFGTRDESKCDSFCHGK